MLFHRLIQGLVPATARQKAALPSGKLTRREFLAESVMAFNKMTPDARKYSALRAAESAIIPILGCATHHPGRLSRRCYKAFQPAKRPVLQNSSLKQLIWTPCSGLASARIMPSNWKRTAKPSEIAILKQRQGTLELTQALRKVQHLRYLCCEFPRATLQPAKHAHAASTLTHPAHAQIRGFVSSCATLVTEKSRLGRHQSL